MHNFQFENSFHTLQHICLRPFSCARLHGDNVRQCQMCVEIPQRLPCVLVDHSRGHQPKGNAKTPGRRLRYFSITWNCDKGNIHYSSFDANVFGQFFSYCLNQTPFFHYHGWLSQIVPSVFSLSSQIVQFDFLLFFQIVPSVFLLFFQIVPSVIFAFFSDCPVCCFAFSFNPWIHILLISFNCCVETFSIFDIQ